MSDLPPLPDGFTEQQAGGLPPLPDGFTEASSALPPLPEGFTEASPDSSLSSDLTRTFIPLAKGITRAVHATGYGYDDADYQRQMDAYDKLIADAGPARTLADVHSLADAAKYAGQAGVGAIPYAGAAFIGGLPGAVALGALSGGEAAAESPNATDASIATGAGLGGAEAAIPLPFLRGGNGIVSGTVKGALGGAAYGALGGATANIPEAVATGNPSAAIPSTANILDSAAQGAIGMGLMGGIHGAFNPAEAAARPDLSDLSREDLGKAVLAQRISDVVDQNPDLKLGNPNYDAGNGDKAILDNVHNQIASEMGRVWNVVKGDLPEPTTPEQVQQQGALDGIMKSARNKLKGRVGSDDMQTLENAVGGTQEGQILVDLVHQSNALTDLFNGGLKGGVSRFTDYLNPLGHGGPETGFGSVLARAGAGGVRLAELLALYHNPALAVPAAGGYLGGRAIDALTGRRSVTAKFVRDNPMPTSLPDYTGLPSIVQDNANAYAQQQAFQRAQDALNLQAQQRTNLQKASNQFDKQQAASQQAADNQRLADREQQLYTQNRLDNNPGVGGFLRSIYDQTGLLPQSAEAGVWHLFGTGAITPQETKAFFQSPKDLMGGNVGNHVIDMLDGMARKGLLERDPEWQQASSRPNATQQATIYNPAAYAAQAAGNQARVSAAIDRVNNSELTSEHKQTINDAAAAIGRTNNRQDAAAIRDRAVNATQATPEAQALAHQELTPLVSQIRHATPEAAEQASRPPVLKAASPAEHVETIAAAQDAVDKPEKLGPEFTTLLKQEQTLHRDPSDAMSHALDSYLQRIINADPAQSPGAEGAAGYPSQAPVGPASNGPLARYAAAVSRTNSTDAGRSNGASRPNTSGAVPGRIGNALDVGIRPNELVLARHDTLAAAQQVADNLSKIRPTRVVPEGDRFAVVAGPKPEVSYPTAPVPEPTGYLDPEGRIGAASFVPGRDEQGLDTPQVRGLANRLSHVSEGGMAPPGQNGVYDEGNNTIRVYGGLSPEEHGRVLTHETGHAIEALSGLSTHLKLLKATDPAQGRQVEKELTALSSLQRPHLWADNAAEALGHSQNSLTEYTNRHDELFADGLANYLTNPQETKKVAPTAARFIRDHVNPSDIGKIIAFAGIAGLTLPGIAQGLAFLLGGGDQEQA